MVIKKWLMPLPIGLHKKLVQTPILEELKPIQRLPPLPPLRQGVIQQVILLLPMMMLLQVAPFMQQHRVNAVPGCLHQPGTRRDQTRTAAASPAHPHRPNGQGWAWDAQAPGARRAHCETLIEYLPYKRATPPIASPSASRHQDTPMGAVCPMSYYPLLSLDISCRVHFCKVSETHTGVTHDIQRPPRQYMLFFGNFFSRLDLSR
jgi:hypothetical protein